MATEKKSAAAASKSSRTSAIPLNEFLVRRQDEAGLKNFELAEMTGYSSANVIAMLRNGAMPFPVNKTKKFAVALGIDPVFMLKRVLETRNPELLEVIEEILGENLVTSAEFNLIAQMRKEMEGIELDLDKHPDVRDALHAAAARERALHAASIEQISRNYKPGPKKAAA